MTESAALKVGIIDDQPRIDAAGQKSTTIRLRPELDVSINAVRFHMRSIYEKLQVHSTSQAVSKALRSRIIRNSSRIPIRSCGDTALEFPST
jgi:regulatory LuxR family protein